MALFGEIVGCLVGPTPPVAPSNPVSALDSLSRGTVREADGSDARIARRAARSPAQIISFVQGGDESLRIVLEVTMVTSIT